jgi:hypothetical protein
VFWGIIFPTIALGFLAIVPYIDLTPSRRYAHRRFALSVCFLLISATTVLSYMGLPEFGVANSADSTILHEMVMPPAHNHMGKLLPVPFEQLTPGMYTTRQFEAESGQEAAAVAAFNTEIADDGRGQILLNELQGVDLLAINSLNFQPISADSPELIKAMEFLHHEIEEHEDQLHNAWGGLIVTEAQGNLRRLDVFIVWDEVRIENGRVVFNEEGEPILIMNDDGTPSTRANGDHIFIHEDAQYFAAPGS